MRTDIPLRTLTRTRPADLLPLLGTPNATVLGVESLELPSVSTALDTLLRLRSKRGTDGEALPDLGEEGGVEA